MREGGRKKKRRADKIQQEMKCERNQAGAN
jgi:hypothetical protein